MISIVRSILLLIPLAIVSMSTPCSPEQLPGSVRYVEAQNTWPLSYSERGQAKGIFPDTARLVFESLGVVSSIRFIPEARIIPEIRENHADASSIMVSDDVRPEDYPDFLHSCATPIVVMNNVATWLKDGPVVARNFEDLSKYRVGLYRVAPVLLGQIKSSIPALEYFNSVNALVKSLLSGRVDVILMNWPQTQAVAARLGGEERIQRGLTLKTYYFHLVIRRGWAANKEQLDKVCKRVETLQRQGEFDEIYRTYYNLK